MANDIRIKVYPTVDKGQAESELAKVIADLEKNAKKIKVGMDDKELLSQIAELKKQIDSLTKGNKKSGNSKMFQGEAKSAKELVAEYKKLISEKDKLETKMSKQTYKGQAYKALSKDLTKVNKDIESVGSKIDALNKKNIKSDITSSLNSSFESTIKKVTELGTSLENALGKRKLAGGQVADIKTLQNQVEKFKKEANLQDILKADKPYAEMSKLITKADELSRSFKKLELTDNLSKSIRKAESDASILQNKIKSLYTKGYGDNNAIDKLFTRAKELGKINIKVNSKTAEADVIALDNDIKKLDADYKSLVADMQRNKKMDVFKINVSATMKNLESLRTQFASVGKDTSGIDALKTRLEGLNKLTFVQAQAEFSKIKASIGELSADIPKATSAMNQFNKLMNERASLEKQMSKTTDTQSYDVLNRKLEENLSKIKKLSAELDVIKNKNINPDITKSLASTFNQLQNSATKTSQTIDNMFKNKNLTGTQVQQLENLRKEIDRIKGTKLDNILNVSNSHEIMATLLRDLQNVKTLAKDIEINGNFNARIESAYKKVAELGREINNLKNVKGFLNTADLQYRLQQVIALFNSDLKNVKININSDSAITDLRTLLEIIQLVDGEVKELTTISNNAKKSFDFTTSVNKSLTRIDALINALNSMGKSTSSAEKLKKDLQDLSNLPLGEAESKLKRINDEINNMSKNTTGIKTQTDALREYNKLIGQRDALEKRLSKLKPDSQAYKVLEAELGKVEDRIKAVTSLMQNVKLPEGNINSVKNYAQEFSNIEKHVSTLESKLSNLMGKSGLSQGQTSNLTKLKTDLDALKNVNLNDILKMDKPYEQISKMITEIERLDSELRQMGDNISLSEKIGKQATDAKNRLSQLQSQAETFKKTKWFGDSQDIDKFIQKIKTLSNLKINFDSSNAEDEVRILIEYLDKLESEFGQLKEASNMNMNNFNLDTAIRSATSRLDTLQRKFQTLGKDITPITNLRNQLQGLDNLSLKEAEAQIRRVNQEASNLEKGFQRAANASKKASSSISSSMKKTSTFISNLYSTLSTYSLGNILGMQITKGIYAIKETITDLDSAFRDMEKVAPASFTGTKEELQEVKDMAFATGQEVARSSVDIINSTASAFQLGIDNVKQAMEYAKNVNMYANVAETKFCLCL